MSTNMFSRTLDFVFLALVAAFCGLFAYSVKELPVVASAVPYGVIVLLGVFVTLVLVDELRAAPEASSSGPPREEQSRPGRTFALLIAATTALVAFAPALTMAVSAPAFTVITALILGERSPLRILGLALVTLILVVGLFQMALGVRLP